MTDSFVPSNQQRRTRTSLLQAAGRLMAQGGSPTVAQVADEALVSRRTAYRYFPTADQLLADAALELTRDNIDRQISATDPVQRADELVATINAMTVRHEQALRTLVRTTIDSPRHPDGPQRGLRRMAWIEQVLAPVKGQLSAHTYRRVTAALALTVGIEARLSLVDVAGLSDAEADLVSRWVARIIIQAALDGSDPVAKRRRR